MIKKITLIGIIVAQLSIPAALISANQRILDHGAVYKFKTAPVDPYDIFRGRYVALRNEQWTAPFSYSGYRTFSRQKSNAYAVIGIDHDGFAYVERIVVEKPETENYFKTTVSYFSSTEPAVHFTFPIDRYYMNERKAPKAESLYRKHSMLEERDAYMVVRVLDGKMVIEQLVIGGKPVESYF